ncbi:MAG: hypothetical protein IID54_04315 [Proteobacteria bacterium]|nr:hypothetical protein [Pseudomonadota bacterium]
MRLIGVIPSVILGVLALMLPGGAFAQTWTEYVSGQDRFHIVFPGEPQVEEVEWISADGLRVPARRYSAEQGDNHYSITVIDYEGARLGTMLGSMAHAATAFRQKGDVTIDAYAQLDRIGGHQLQITEPDGRLLYVAIYLHDNFLYVTEASVPLTSPRGTIFQHSLSITDENGIRVRYNRDGTRNFERQLGD